MNIANLAFHALAKATAPKQKIHICQSTHNGDADQRVYTLLIDGEVYTNVNRFLLAALYDGQTPAELGIEPDWDDATIQGEKL